VKERERDLYAYFSICIYYYCYSFPDGRKAKIKYSTDKITWTHITPKIKLFVCLIKQQATKTYGIILHAFLICTLDGVTNSTLQPLYPRGNSLRYPLDRRLCGPYSQSGYSEKEKTLCPCQESNPDSLVIQPTAYSLTERGIFCFMHAKCQIKKLKRKSSEKTQRWL
jgi:hypothetical protein